MSFLLKGKEKELEFAKLFENYTPSSKKEDIEEHWDLKIEYKVDVKALKKVRRHNDEADENYHWVEIKNVDGELGWLYGKADFFAFELKEFWVIVSKKDLQDRIAKKTVKEYYPKPTIYGLYRRKNRMDAITLVPTIDLCCISTTILKK